MGKKILFADDEPDILTVALFRLKEAGYEVVTAVNGKEVLDLLKDGHFDLLLLDLRLPVINGFEICKKIRSDERLKHILVIIFSASVDKLMLGAKECGASDCLAKPFESEQLLDKVKKVIG